MDIIFGLVIILFSAILHEVSHGLAARSLGDKTAEYAGRLSLDPRVHIDFYGSILLPLILWFVSSGSFFFAYAKPVPYNPFNLKNQKWGPALVAFAGPATNFVIAITMSLLIASGIFSYGVAAFLVQVLIINVSLGVFNLIPIPPLDGSKILFAALPSRYHHLILPLEQYGFFIVFGLVIFFPFVISYPVQVIARFLI